MITRRARARPLRRHRVVHHLAELPRGRDDRGLRFALDIFRSTARRRLQYRNSAGTLRDGSRRDQRPGSIVEAAGSHRVAPRVDCIEATLAEMQHLDVTIVAGPFEYGPIKRRGGFFCRSMGQSARNRSDAKPLI